MPTDFVANSTLLAEIEKNWLRIAPALLDYNYTVSQHQKDETSLKIKQFYMKGEPISRATTAPFIQVSLQILTSLVDNLSIHNEVLVFLNLWPFVIFLCAGRKLELEFNIFLLAAFHDN